MGVESEMDSVNLLPLFPIESGILGFFILFYFFLLLGVDID